MPGLQLAIIAICIFGSKPNCAADVFLNEDSCHGRWTLKVQTRSSGSQKTTENRSTWNAFKLQAIGLAKSDHSYVRHSVRAGGSFAACTDHGLDDSIRVRRYQLAGAAFAVVWSPQDQ